MRGLVGVLGFLLGVIAGVALLLGNPLAYFRGLPPLPPDLAPAKSYRWDDYRGMRGGVADLLGIAGRDAGVALMDPALQRVRAGIVVLPAGEGTPAALALKVSAIAEENSLWRAELGTHDYWSITWPGEGGVFANAYSNQWTLARDSFFALVLGNDSLATAYPVTAPPPAAGVAAVTGATGRYAGFTGEIRETLYPAKDGRGVDWAVSIKVNPPPVAPR